MNSYHNTNHEPWADLQTSEHKAQVQEGTILYLFKRTLQGLTPDQVHEMLYGHTSVPITSVRRAITNLTSQGKLEKTDQRRAGSFGKKVFVWRAVRRPGVQANLFETN